jgi:hypothetical protein
MIVSEVDQGSDGSEPHEPSRDVEDRLADIQQQETDDLIAARAKAAELDERLDKLEQEAFPKAPNPQPIGGMVGT